MSHAGFVLVGHIELPSDWLTLAARCRHQGGGSAILKIYLLRHFRCARTNLLMSPYIYAIGEVHRQALVEPGHGPGDGPRNHKKELLATPMQSST